MTDLADILAGAIGTARAGRHGDIMAVLDRIETRAQQPAGARYSAPEPHVQQQIDAALSDFLASPGGEAVFRHLAEQFVWRANWLPPTAPVDRDARMEYAAMRQGQASVVELMLRCAMRHRAEKPLPPR